jgi:sucrose phosphorylase
MDLLAKTNVGRDINRHYYSKEEVELQMGKPLVQDLIKLINLRNTHPAFNGTFKLLNLPNHQLGINWNFDQSNIFLSIDLEKRTMRINYTEPNGSVAKMEFK